MNRRDAEIAEVLDTERCFLPLLSLDHQADIFKLYCHPDVQKYLGGTLDDKATFQKRFDEIFNEEMACNRSVFLTENHEFIGVVFLGLHHNKQDYEVGFKFLPAYWGCGFAFETVEACLTDAKITWNLSSIVAETQKQNMRSRRFLEKLGFKKEDELTRHGSEQTFYRKTF